MKQEGVQTQLAEIKQLLQNLLDKLGQTPIEEAEEKKPKPPIDEETEKAGDGEKVTLPKDTTENLKKPLPTETDKVTITEKSDIKKGLTSGSIAPRPAIETITKEDEVDALKIARGKFNYAQVHKMARNVKR